MKRRTLIQTGLRSWLLLPLLGHTPFPQWKVYRQRHLFIAIDRSDADAADLGHTLVDILDRDLPEAEAKVTRAINAAGIASLLSTEQLDVALMRKPDAVAWVEGAEVFQAVEPVSLRTLVDLGDYVLLCRKNFPDHHASVIAHTLAHAGVTHPAEPPSTQAAAGEDAIATPIAATDLIPLHPGVFLR
ncbi:MAG: hypothetical protein ICV77_17810 [Cyanobacteria bacterium Co-bin8]|nr:hypothetical protein [Cyanobacteria bacterium Co-bin8]